MASPTPGGYAALSHHGFCSRHWKALLVAAVLATLALWPYLVVLSAVVYNYAFWVTCSSTVTEVSDLPRAAQGESGTPVPKILHQTWKDDHLPEKWKAAQQSCIDKHPGYQYMLWSDEDALELIRTKYPWFLETYLSYPHNIQRVDAMRYFVLHSYGGIYLDLDIVCDSSLDLLRSYQFTAPKTYPVGLSNDVLSSAPGSVFSERLIRNLAFFNKWFFVKYATVMFSTGPMFVTIQYTLMSSEARQGVAVLPAPLYGKYEHTPAALMTHLHGSSWHSDDAKLVFFLEKHGLVLAAFGAFAVFTVAVGAWLVRQRQQHAGQALRGGAVGGSGGMLATLVAPLMQSGGSTMGKEKPNMC